MTADIIDLDTRRRGIPQTEPTGSMSCTFDVAPGVVTVAISTPDDAIEFGLSPEHAEQLASRLMSCAIRARLASENGDDE